MTRHWWVLVVLLVAFGVAGRIDYEAQMEISGWRHGAKE